MVVGRHARFLAALCVVAGLSVASRPGQALGEALTHPSKDVACSDSWVNAGGGSWSTGSNWSTGSPPVPGDDVCIDLAGTYSVTLPATTATINSLTLGGTSGTQTLVLQADGCIGSTNLTLTS